MKSIKQVPLLATIAAMVLLAISTENDVMRILAILVGIAALFIFVRDNLKKNNS